MRPVVHLVLPNDIDDPAAPSGGNVYDRRISRGLAALGWTVVEHPVRGAWPRPGEADLVRIVAYGAITATDHVAQALTPAHL